MRVAGLDVSTMAAHYAIWDGQSAVAYGAMTKRDEVEGLLRMNVDAVYIEEIPWVRNSQTMRKLCQAVGCWMERCEAVGLKVETIPVARWKMLSVGNGAATKDFVRDMILATTNMFAGMAQDEYDACGIAIAGYQTEKTNTQLAGASVS